MQGNFRASSSSSIASAVASALSHRKTCSLPMEKVFWRNFMLPSDLGPDNPIESPRSGFL
jgi:hypothetical protein